LRKSAAIYGLRNKANISIFILHPKGRVSPIQEAQMTTVTDANVHNIAVKATFDDCQVRYHTIEPLNLSLPDSVLFLKIN
jgi:threonine synthase